MGIFDRKYNKLNDEDINAAILLTSLQTGGKCIGGIYCLDKNILVMAPILEEAYEKLKVDDAERLMVYKVMKRHLPSKYKLVNFLTISTFNERIPEDIQKMTGFVDMFHPEHNR